MLIMTTTTMLMMVIMPMIYSDLVVEVTLYWLNVDEYSNIHDIDDIDDINSDLVAEVALGWLGVGVKHKRVWDFHLD